MGPPFWDFSIAVYSESAAQNECLDLQDRFGVDVNLILLCAFLGAVHGLVLTSDDIASARQEVRQWHDDIVRSLRTARRKLKAAELGGDDATRAAVQLGAQVKAAELESERIEQMVLQRWADARAAGRPRGKASEAVAANLQTLLTAYGAGNDPLAFARHLIAAALDQAAK